LFDGAVLDGPPPASAAPQDLPLKPPRPLRLLPRPEPVDVTGPIQGVGARPTVFRWRKLTHEIARAEGPERIAPEWWLELDKPPSPARDYYHVEDRAGRRFWLFREVEDDLERWCLHGQFG